MEIHNALASIFREKNLSYARQILDKLQYEYELGNKLELPFGIRVKPISEEHFLDARRLYKLFSLINDFKLRVESNVINVYSNNIAWLDKVSTEISPSNAISMYRPKQNFKEQLDKNTILVKKSNGYQLKVTLGGKRGSADLAHWAAANPSLVKLGPKLKEELLESGYVNGMYFYVRDERILHLCSLITDNIRRVDKLVVNTSLDK